MNKKIAVVVPTIRPEKMTYFKDVWADQFSKYNVTLIEVFDGENPSVYVNLPGGGGFRNGLKNIMGGNIDLISNFNSSIRNLGFYVASKMDFDVIVTLDDDTEPYGDTIGDHLRQLEKSVPISWLSTTVVHDNKDYMRGFPYGIRKEAPVMLSHGVWQGVPDRDAPNQLIVGEDAPVEFYRGPIPKGIYFPFCGMNVAFKIEALPFVYYAPVGQFKGAERFDDIWGGIAFKEDFDEHGFAIMSGFASVFHKRASDPFKNLEREAVGIRENEHFWDKSGVSNPEWFLSFMDKRLRWRKIILDNLICEKE